MNKSRKWSSKYSEIESLFFLSNQIAISLITGIVIAHILCVGSRYQKKHSHTHTHPDHRTSFIHSVHFTCLTVLSYNLSPGPLWSSSWSWTLNFILHTFLHPIIIFFLQHIPIPMQPVLLQYQRYVIYT